MCLSAADDAWAVFNTAGPDVARREL